MSREMELFKTAQFARMCNVSKQTLIYYDRLGIFKPDYVDKNGYRYYRFSQCETFRVIVMLRELDTPLKEISEYLNNKTPQLFLELLDRKQKEVSQRIERLKNLEYVINQRQHMTKEGISADINKVIIKHMEEEHIILSKNIKGVNEEEKEQINSKLERKLYEEEPDSLCIGAIVDKDELLKEEDYNISYFFAKTSKKSKNTLIKPAGNYVIAYHRGHYSETALTYTKMMSFIRIRNREVIGNSYEEVLMDACTHQNEYSFLMKISIPIK